MTRIRLMLEEINRPEVLVVVILQVLGAVAVLSDSIVATKSIKSPMKLKHKLAKKPPKWLELWCIRG